ncbi:hypothetical protein HHI36_022251 [Cryptolaemus montrouzieri]|uniref:MADF domain-containing protein n=1 Tax=Cryptolaemus montrouzieri TaxID=559131 RepID=A0ABD2N022_9CUCU
MRWTDEKTVKFVELYLSCLWDNTSTNYSNKQLRDSAIQSIVNEMEIEVFGPNDVENKIKIYGPHTHRKSAKLRKARNQVLVLKIYSRHEMVQYNGQIPQEH